MGGSKPGRKRDVSCRAYALVTGAPWVVGKDIVTANAVTTGTVVCDEVVKSITERVCGSSGIFPNGTTPPAPYMYDGVVCARSQTRKGVKLQSQVATPKPLVCLQGMVNAGLEFSFSGKMTFGASAYADQKIIWYNNVTSPVYSSVLTYSCVGT